MLSEETMLEVLATVIALFISLLPITYMSWRDRFIESVRREARLIEGLGEWIRINENEKVVIKGPFRTFNIIEEVEAQQAPKSITELEEKLRQESPLVRFEQNAPMHPDSPIIDGINRLANNCLKRGFMTFMALLVIYSSILFIAAFAAGARLPPSIALPIDFNGFMILGLLIGLISYVLFASVMFTDRQISWHVPPRLKENGTATKAMLDTLWRQG